MGAVETMAGAGRLVLAAGGASFWGKQPRAIATSVTARAETRLTTIAARYTVARTYAKRTLTLLTLLSRFV
jgi:hypothetical protein